MFPLEVITQVVRLLNNVLELAAKDPTATAKWVTAFWIFWPLFKGRVTAEQAKQIEDLVRSIRTEEEVKPNA